MNAEQQDILIRIGTAVLVAQTAERAIRLCMTFVLQKDSPLTLEVLERQVREERRKTLGYFLTQLRQRADLAEEFDALLDSFLEERNRLVHGVSDMPGWSLDDAQGLRIARSFVDGFILKTVEVVRVFTGLTRAWQQKANIDVPFPVEHEFFAEIDAIYKEQVNSIFFQKDS